MYLNELLASVDFCAGIEPRIGSRHIRVIAIDGFPKCSFPGVLSEIDSLPMEYRWSTRAILLDPMALQRRFDLQHAEYRFRSPHG